MAKIYRYPGVEPFTEEDQTIFFGRDDDTRELLRLTNLENLVVFYGKSGLGKTSLINVKILPKLQIESNFQPILMRLSNYNEKSPSNPAEVFDNQLHHDNTVKTYIDDIPVSHVTLWQSLKKLQLTNNTYSSGQFILVIDQFEELFTYPEGVEEFGNQLSDILNQRIPQEFRKTLRRALAVDDELQKKITDKEMEDLLSPINVKMVLSIRSDRLSMLYRLKTSLPNILQNFYELAPLNVNQAKEAIIKPAQQEGTFLSPKFEYTSSSLEKIINFLQKKENGRTRLPQPIESFQLQIICQHIESLIIDKDIEKLSDRDLGEVERVFENFYDNQISRIGTPEEQSAVRKMIEEGLIFEKEERRLTLYEGQIINEYHISLELLKEVVATRLIRAIPHSSGSYIYELTHDTLVAPILKSKFRRKREAKIKRLEAEKKLKEKREHFYRKMTWIVLIPAIVFFALAGIFFDKWIDKRDDANNARFLYENMAKKMEETNTEKDNVITELRATRQIRKHSDSQIDIIIESMGSEGRNSLIKHYSEITESHFSVQDYKEAVRFEESLVDLLPKLNVQKSVLANEYGKLAWYQLFNQQPKNALYSAQYALNIDDSQKWIYKNMALAYLFSNEYTEALELYQKWKNIPYRKKSKFRTYRDAFLYDIRELENAGITHDDISKIEKLLK